LAPGSLIPRADSEILVEAGLDACRKISAKPIAVLDICTGTGCIGISLSLHLQELGLASRLWLTDLDPTAADYARGNLIRHHLAEQSTLEIADLFPADPSLCWDLIVANPPYIANPVIASLMPEVRCYEPLTALDGGMDGLDFYRRLIAGASSRLKPGGCLLLEHGYDQALAVADLINSTGQYDLIPAIRDYGGQPRVSGGWRK
jgi:release factor glutamine methyltransferase